MPDLKDREPSALEYCASSLANCSSAIIATFCHKTSQHVICNKQVSVQQPAEMALWLPLWTNTYETHVWFPHVNHISQHLLLTGYTSVSINTVCKGTCVPVNYLAMQPTTQVTEPGHLSMVVGSTGSTAVDTGRMCLSLVGAYIITG